MTSWNNKLAKSHFPEQQVWWKLINEKKHISLIYPPHFSSNRFNLSFMFLNNKMAQKFEKWKEKQTKKGRMIYIILKWFKRTQKTALIWLSAIFVLFSELKSFNSNVILQYIQFMWSHITNEGNPTVSILREALHLLHWKQKYWNRWSNTGVWWGGG